MLLMKLQCWCEILMWLLPDDVTTGAASWLLSLMWDAHSMGWKEWGDWLVLWSQLAMFIIVIDYPVPLISLSHSSSDWSDGWPDLQLMSLIHSSLLNYNWIVIWLILITSMVFLTVTDWLILNVTPLIIVTQICCTHKSSFWMGLSVGWQLMLMIFLLCKNI